MVFVKDKQNQYQPYIWVLERCHNHKDNGKSEGLKIKSEELRLSSQTFWSGGAHISGGVMSGAVNSILEVKSGRNRIYPLTGF